MTPYLMLIAFIGTPIAAGVIYAHVAEWRRRRCSGCMIENLGGGGCFVAHTCSRSRAVYTDRKGRRFAFGKQSKWQPPEPVVHHGGKRKRADPADLFRRLSQRSAAGDGEVVPYPYTVAEIDAAQEDYLRRARDHQRAGWGL